MRWFFCICDIAYAVREAQMLKVLCAVVLAGASFFRRSGRRKCVVLSAKAKMLGRRFKFESLISLLIFGPRDLG